MLTLTTKNQNFYLKNGKFWPEKLKIKQFDLKKFKILANFDLKPEFLQCFTQKLKNVVALKTQKSNISIFNLTFKLENVDLNKQKSNISITKKPKWWQFFT